LVEIKFSKILVGVDGSKESMDTAYYAIGLAKKDNAKLICALLLCNFHPSMGGPLLNLQQNGKKKIERRCNNGQNRKD
jgi:hypothetical protein